MGPFKSEFHDKRKSLNRRRLAQNDQVFAQHLVVENRQHETNDSLGEGSNSFLFTWIITSILVLSHELKVFLIHTHWTSAQKSSIIRALQIYCLCPAQIILI